MLKKILFIFFICISCIIYAKEIKNIEVLDGDTIAYTENNKRTRVRFYGIDAPESHQEFGKESTQYLSSLLKDKKAELIVVSIDMYSRELALVYVDKECINVTMVVNGYAWFYPFAKPVCNAFKYHEQYAKEHKLGLWNTKDPKEPWIWRKENK